ncbi:type II toxin-antitoxin system VapC family toxin [Fibrella aquatica]|uniref:type II toxin-antitoxin system VapC family toxin n=1 Tax=Fibrella aquatica TaxID=3242487 RepID=UPI003520A6E1
MSYLLDTHTLIWALTDPDKLSPTTRAILTDGSDDILVSAISFWEISLKHSLQKMTLEGIVPEDFPKAAEATGFRLLSLDTTTVSTYHRLAATYHKDPFDRMLIWQAIQSNYRLISKDENVSKYVSEGLQVIW